MTESRLRTFIAYVEDLPGVLNRVTSLFRRRGYNIESLTVGRTHEPGVSRMTIVMEADDDAARRIEANLYKLVNVLRVEDMTAARDGRARARAHQGARGRRPAPERHAGRARCSARASSTSAPEALICEITGTADKIDGLVDVLEPFGIVEMVRTGAVAMVRSAEVAEARRRRRRRSGRALDDAALRAAEDSIRTRRNKTMAKMYLRQGRRPRTHPQQEGRDHRLRLAGPRARAQPEGERRRREGRPPRDEQGPREGEGRRPRGRRPSPRSPPGPTSS